MTVGTAGKEFPEMEKLDMKGMPEHEEEQAEGGDGENEESYELPDLQFSDSEQENIMDQEEMKKRAAWRRLRRLYNKFTSKLRIPCYKKLSYFYYYDVLEACSRVLFQNDLNQNHGVPDLTEPLTADIFSSNSLTDRDPDTLTK